MRLPQVDEFLFEVDDLADEMSEPIMVGVLDAIQTMRTDFEDVIKPRVNQLSERYNVIDAEANELTEAGVEDAFARYTLQDVYDKCVPDLRTTSRTPAPVQAHSAP